VAGVVHTYISLIVLAKVFKNKSKPPVELVVCSTRETLGYWLMSKDILKGPPTALRFLTDR